MHSLHQSKEGTKGKQNEITKWQGNQLIPSHTKHDDSPKAMENL